MSTGQLLVTAKCLHEINSTANCIYMLVKINTVGHV